MKNLKANFALAFVAILFSSAAAAQSVPLEISYQAVLTDDAGDPLSPGAPTNYNIIFRIYDSVEGGTLLWAEIQGVSVFEGSFSTLLGTGDPVGTGESTEPRPALDTVFDASERFLQITIEDGTLKTFTPRQRMVSAPFAFKASVADKALNVVSGAVATDQLVNGAVNASKLGSDSVTADKVAANAIGSSEIAANAVGSSEIANESVNISKLAIAVQNLLMPAGTVVAWAGTPTTIPVGWRLCDGSAISKTSYPDLFAAIGETYGTEGSEFNLPDYRGYFLRADALDTGHDPNREGRIKNSIGGFEGSEQTDDFGSHRHNWRYIEGGTGTSDRDGTWDTTNNNQRTVTRQTLFSGGSETRPKNKYVHYIIKAH